MGICTVTFPGVTPVLSCSVELRPHFALLLIEYFINMYICIYTHTWDLVCELTPGVEKSV